MGFRDEFTDFYSRLQGKERIKISTGGPNILDSVPTEEERSTKRKIWQLNQHVRLKSSNRRYLQFFDEFRQMDVTYPIVKAALDIYAEETVNKDLNGNLIKINTKDEKVKNLLKECFFQNLNLNKRAFIIAREFCKFGNVYAYLVTRQGDGVTDIVFLPPDALVREQMLGLAAYEEQMDFEKINEYKFVWHGTGGAGTLFEPWEIVHWKNSEDLESEPYGVSILRPIVETWRRVILLREALIVYRITRAPQRYLFKIATDGLSGEEAYKFAQEVKKEIKKKPMVDAKTGEIDFKHNPMSVMDDFFIPVSSDNNSDVGVLDGANNLDSIEDYKIIKSDLFAGLKIPKAYLTFEEELSNKAALGEEDVRFSKTIQRIQTEFIQGLVHIGIVHLFLNGCSTEEIQSFSIEMAHSSVVAEKEKWELMEAKIAVAEKLWNESKSGLNFMTYAEVMKTVFKFSDEEIERSIKRQFIEKKINWRLGKLSEDGYYDNPELDLLVNKIKNITPDNNLTNQEVDVFKTLQFENIKPVLENKIQQELDELFKKPEVTPTKPEIKSIRRMLTGNLQKTRKDLL
jgi:hypothetical protein